MESAKRLPKKCHGVAEVPRCRLRVLPIRDLSLGAIFAVNSPHNPRWVSVVNSCSGSRLVGGAMNHERPGDASVPVCHGDGRDIDMAASQELAEP